MDLNDINLNDLTDEQAMELWEAVHTETDSIAMSMNPEEYLTERGWSQAEIDKAREENPDLDDVSLEDAGERAASINNSGEEVSFLRERGWSEADIKTYIADRL